MIIVIDGYNVLKQAIHKNVVSDNERASFVNQLKRYSKKKGHRINLVFDGGPYDWATKERYDGVYVIYAGAGRTADDYIKSYLGEKRNLDILLVSSDRDICRFAKRLDIEYIDSAEFYDILQRSLQVARHQKSIKQTKAIKTTTGENEELDSLMEKASKFVEYKAEDFKSSHELGASRSETASKKKKKKLKQLKKL